MLNYSQAYFEAIKAIQEQVMATQQESMRQAVEILSATLKSGGRIFIFGSGHSHLLAEEGHYRAGGLAAVVPILHNSLMLHEGAILSTMLERQMGIARPLLARYQPTAEDCIIVISNSGVNAVPVEMAMAASEAGMKVIAIVARAYAAQAKLSPVGVRLTEVANVVIDNCGVPGDAIIPIQSGDVTIKAGPSSTIVGALILNSLFVEVAGRIAEESNMPPPVYTSANIPGSAERNQALMETVRKKNPHL